MYKKNYNLRHSASPTGFSLLEMMVVIAIIAILAMMAYPAFTDTIKKQRVRHAAEAVASASEQARLRAANTQKPIRLIVDCSKYITSRPADPQPCFLIMESAGYANGVIVRWDLIPSTRKALDTEVIAIIADDVDNDGAIIMKGVYWAIFMPDGKVKSYPKHATENSFDVYLSTFISGSTSDDDYIKPDLGTWQVKVNNTTGRTNANILK